MTHAKEKRSKDTSSNGPGDPWTLGSRFPESGTGPGSLGPKASGTAAALGFRGTSTQGLGLGAFRSRGEEFGLR